jgi:hypothetical protein
MTSYSYAGCPIDHHLVYLSTGEARLMLLHLSSNDRWRHLTPLFPVQTSALYSWSSSLPDLALVLLFVSRKLARQANTAGAEAARQHCIIIILL